MMNVLIEVVLGGEMEWLQKEELEGFVKASYCGGGVIVFHVTSRSQSEAPSETSIRSLGVCAPEC
jgi:hypothetical protein